MNGWKRATRRHPCPVCGRPNAKHTSGWCTYTSDGCLAICPFTPEGARRHLPEAGYLHVVGEPNGGQQSYPRRETHRPVVNWALLQRHLVDQVTDGMLVELSAELGVTELSLKRLGVGYNGSYTFPMTDGRRIIGIRTRENGKKRAVWGSKNGLFVPTGRTNEGPMVVCEGPTDCAALLDLGFDAVGRASCATGGSFILRLVNPERSTVIVADADEAGRLGARMLANAIRHSGCYVQIVEPPTGIKDAREWKKVDERGLEVMLRALAPAQP